jgi:hypothetical protein
VAVRAVRMDPSAAVFVVTIVNDLSHSDAGSEGWHVVCPHGLFYGRTQASSVSQPTYIPPLKVDNNRRGVDSLYRGDRLCVTDL